MVDLKAKKTDFWKPHFDTIVSDENFNVRTEYGDIEALAESIKISGLKVPLRGYRKEDKWFITDGHRRYRAIKLLREQEVELDYIPFIVEPRHYSQEDRVFDLFLTNDSKPLTDLEQGELFKRLINYGYSIKEISNKIQRSESHILKCLEIINLPKRVKNLIEENKLTSSAALIATKKYSPEQVIEIAEKATTTITSSSIEQFKYYFKINNDGNISNVSFNKFISLIINENSLINSFSLIQYNKQTKVEKILFYHSFNDLFLEYHGKDTLVLKDLNKIIYSLKLLKGIKSVVNLTEEVKRFK